MFVLIILMGNENPLEIFGSGNYTKFRSDGGITINLKHSNGRRKLNIKLNLKLIN